MLANTQGLFLAMQETGSILCILKQECLNSKNYSIDKSISGGEDILINHFPSENSPPILPPSQLSHFSGKF